MKPAITSATALDDAKAANALHKLYLANTRLDRATKRDMRRNALGHDVGRDQVGRLMAMGGVIRGSH